MKTETNNWNNKNNQNEHNLLIISNNNNSEDIIINSSSCPSSNSPNGNESLLNNNNLQKPDLEYLGLLLKDKKQLSAFPNVFSHVERLVDEEINRVRVSIFQCEFSREPLQLPEAIGEISIHQEKLFVPVKQYPDYNFVGRILGPRGMTAKQLETETGCKIMVRGKGSMRDKKKEDSNRGKPNWEHLNEDLHVIIQCEDTENRAKIKMSKAIEEVNKLLIPQPEGEDDLKRKQLMELAIINGTFRNSIPIINNNNTTNNNTNISSYNSNKLNNSLLQLDQHFLLGSLGNSSATLGLAGVPLMITPNSTSPLIKGIGGSGGGIPLNNNSTLSSLTNASIAQTLLQLNGISNNILNNPGPYGLSLPQQNNGNPLDLVSFGSNQFQQDQQQQLSLLLQQQQMALLQQQQNNGGITLGEYTNNFGGTDSSGQLLISSIS
ncbi:RNA-binding protein asd-2 [Meloidogyne graminicola]|uniref:RNA-binding protein asd-2 n=1 Tax=Meloidogyne graminicola TaxID=189291 RepID=A0A8S9ZYX7_9BILA|nr:RNA-binding protein asd-2 [Meloidogyne graminicola]